MTGGGAGASIAAAMQADSPIGPLANATVRHQVRAEEWRLVDALRAGDEAAFVTLVERHHTALVRLARLYVPIQAADALAQAVWAALLANLVRPPGPDRSVSLRVVLFQLLLDCARSHRPEGTGTVPFAAHWSIPAELRDAPTLHPSYFRPSDPWIGHWAAPLPAWDVEPGDQSLARDVRGIAEATLATLPPPQREVVILRDVEAWAPDEVSGALGIDLPTQRALLHHGRARIRTALDARVTSSE